MYLKILETSVLKYMNLIPLIIFSPPWLAWQASLKKTEIELELLTDIDMLLIVEKKYWGGYVMQYIDMQKQIISIWKITINALNQYFLCI